MALDLVLRSRGIVRRGGFGTGTATGLRLLVRGNGLLQGGNPALRNTRVGTRQRSPELGALEDALHGGNPAGAIHIEGGKAHHLAELRRFVQLTVVVGVFCGKTVGRLPHQRCSPGLPVHAVEAGLVGVGIVVEGIPLAHLVTQSGGELACTLANLTYRGKIQIELESALVIVTDSALHPETELTHGLLGDEIHRPGRGVTSVQSALRTAQNFNAFQFGHVHGRAHHLADIDTIEIDSHCGVEREVGRITRSEAAHTDTGGTA